MSILKNLLEYYRKADGTTQRQIPGFIFAGKGGSPTTENRSRKLFDRITA